MSEIAIQSNNDSLIHIENSSIATGNIVTTSNQVVSSNIDELQTLIDELSIAVSRMSEALSGEEKKRVARALETLKEEAKNEKPDKQWWSVSIEGLKKAAKDIGEIGKPVLDIVVRLVPILAQKST